MKNLRAALDLYQKAVARSRRSRARAAIAAAYVVLPGYTEVDDDPEELFKLAESSARRALTPTRTSGGAAVLAQINAERGDLLDAESGFFFAISLEPNEAAADYFTAARSRRAHAGGAQTGAKGADARPDVRRDRLEPRRRIPAARATTKRPVTRRWLATGSRQGQDQRPGRGHRVHKGQWEQAKSFWLRRQPATGDQILHWSYRRGTGPARRPAAIAEMRRIDPKIAKQTDLIGPYLQLGAVDQVYDTLFEALDRDGRSWATTWDFEHVWNVDGRKFRADPRFARLAQRIGIVDYWKQYGFPDFCQAGQDTVIVCS